MRNARFRSPRSGVPRIFLVVLALIASTLLGATAAPATTPCTGPPTAYPEGAITPGLVGTGYTTISGTTPTQFDVEVLGVIPDYIWLDIDVIVVRIKGPQSFLDQIGGVFYGMSGSPVYVNDNLLGAVSYGVSWDPTIFGLTPGQTMIDLFGLSGAQGRKVLPERIPFDEPMRRTIAEALGMPLREVTEGLERIPVTFGVSGLSGARLEELQERLDQHGMGVQVGPSGSIDASLPVSSTPFTVGQPIGSVLSWGDYTIWAAGTVSIACGDEVVAYGHSLFGWPPGSISIGMTGATVLAVGNGLGMWPGDMVPVLTEPRGAFVQDRFTGQVGVVGLAPASVSITSFFSSPDTGRSRGGTTEALYQEDWWFVEMVWGHMVLNLGSVFQQLGPGTSDLYWTIEGTREDGTPFSVSNRGMFWSGWDATSGVWKLLSAVEALRWNRFEDIEMTSIDASGSVTEQQLEGDIVRVRTSSGLQPALRSRGVTKVKAGRPLTVEVAIAPADGSADIVTTMKLRIPRTAHGTTTFSVKGGRDRTWLDIGGVGSFDELIWALSGGQHENDLMVSGFGVSKTAVLDWIPQGKLGFAVQAV